MPLRGRVGRHTRHGGRHCQNWPDDQQNVVSLLNRIPVNDGGAGGGLNGNIAGRIVAGMASDSLYGAIVRFEDKHFPGQRSGYVDPAGRMLKRMEELATRPVHKPAHRPAADPIDLPPVSIASTPLERLRENVLDDWYWRQFPADQRADFEPLVTMAVKHIDALKAQGLDRLPWFVELFGRAHVTQGKTPAFVRGSFGFIVKGGGWETPPLPEMRFGSPVDVRADITTEKLGALLLYGSGVCYRVFPYHTGNIYLLEDWNSGRSRVEALPLKK